MESDSGQLDLAKWHKILRVNCDILFQAHCIQEIFFLSMVQPYNSYLLVCWLVKRNRASIKRSFVDDFFDYDAVRTIHLICCL